MTWELLACIPASVVIVFRDGEIKYICWNDAVQKMLAYPMRVDVLHDAEENRLGFRHGASYLIVKSDDEREYRVYCAEAIAPFLPGLIETYETSPSLIDHSEGEVSGMVGAIWIPLPE